MDTITSCGNECNHIVMLTHGHKKLLDELLNDFILWNEKLLDILNGLLEGLPGIL